MHRDFIRANLEGVLRDALQRPRLEIVNVAAEVREISLEDQPWLPVKYGAVRPEDWHGLVPLDLTYRDDSRSVTSGLSLMAKVIPARSVGESLTPWVLERHQIDLGRAYSEFFAASELLATSPREGEVYRRSARVGGLRAVVPRFYGELVDERGERLLLLERIEGIESLDPGGGDTTWAADRIDAAIRAAAAYQAPFVGHEGDLTWAGPRPTTDTMQADEAMWRAFVENARSYHAGVVSQTAAHRRHRLIDTIESWCPAKDAMPTTLVHDDYNPRNVGFRPGDEPLRDRVVVLDWEVAARDTPQRDLVEFLTFALDDTVDRTTVEGYVELHRACLADLGVEIEPQAWAEAFRAELFVEALNRVGLQGIWAREFELAFYPAINATIEHLLDLYE